MAGISGIFRLDNQNSNLIDLGAVLQQQLQHRGSEVISYLGDFSGLRQGTIEKPEQLSLVLQQNSRKSSSYTTQQASITVLFDGYLNNQAWLRKELGLQEKVSTPEIIIAAYQQWGTDCFRHFSGAFAILLHDVQKAHLVAGRDSTGIRPFYFYQYKGTFAWASEQKALLRLPFLPGRMNPQVVYDFFFLQKIEEEESFFLDIQELLPGHLLIFDGQNQTLRQEKYHQVSVMTRVQTFREQDFVEYAQQIRGILDRNQHEFLANHSHPASLLSGGLDSSVLVTSIRQLSGRAPNTFTTCFRDERFDESSWARQVAEYCGSPWFPVYPGREELQEDLEHLAFCQDIPLTSAGTYAQFRAMQLAGQQETRFIFDGQGADALFAGHQPHLAILWRTLLRQGYWKEARKEWGTYPANSLAFYFRILLKNSYLPRFPKVIKEAFRRRYFRELQYFQPDFIRAHQHRGALYNKDTSPDLNTLLSGEYFGSGMRFMLKCVDRSASWNQLEAVLPYADSPELMQLLFQIPANYKIRRSETKVLLRQAFSDLLPKTVLHRKDKKALATPNNLWIEEMKPFIYPYFEQLPGEVINKKQLLRDFDRFFTSSSPYENYRLFKFIGFALWRKVFNL